jgi:GxxExxY protein
MNLIYPELTEKIIGACIEVHKELGPGLLESAYEQCLCCELNRSKIDFKTQVSLPVKYKEVLIDCSYRLDIVVENRVVLEIKAVEKLSSLHEAQLISYLKLSKYEIGLLINFNVELLKRGIKRFINDR